MERTKVIAVGENSLGFEVGETSKWQGEFTLEQVAEFNIAAGREITVSLIEMQDTFADVEFVPEGKAVVPIRLAPHDDEFAFEPPIETETRSIPNPD